MALSVDRFLAIHLHLRYQELVTHKRVVAMVFFIWVLSALLSLTILWAPPDIASLFLCIVIGVGLFLTTMVYIRIYLAARRHKNQVLQVQQVAQTCEISNFANLIKCAVGIFYVYLVFLICYLPYVIGLVAIEIEGSGVTVKKLHYFSLTFVFLNSSLNPVIYCWKMRHIRHAVINILRNMSWLRSRALHQCLNRPVLLRHNPVVLIGVKRLLYATATANSLRYRKAKEIRFKLSDAILQNIE